MTPSPKQNYEAGSNFRPAFFFLNKRQQIALKRVYAYCRIVDDIADDQNATKELKEKDLNEWKAEIENIFNGQPSSQLTKNLLETIKEFNLKKEHFLLILEGMKMDMRKNEYQTLEELKSYMYHVASAVAFLCMDIFGYDGLKSEEYAENIGYALQLTNITRDVFEDVKINRIYLPNEDMRKFGYAKEELKKCVYSDNFIELMKFESQRAHDYYRKAHGLVDPLKKKKLLPLFIMAELYEAILSKAEKNNFESLMSKTKLSALEKLKAIYKAWRKSC